MLRYLVLFKKFGTTLQLSPQSSPWPVLLMDSTKGKDHINEGSVVRNLLVLEIWLLTSPLKYMGKFENIVVQIVLFGFTSN